MDKKRTKKTKSKTTEAIIDDKIIDFGKITLVVTGIILISFITYIFIADVRWDCIKELKYPKLNRTFLREECEKTESGNFTQKVIVKEMDYYCTSTNVFYQASKCIGSTLVKGDVGK